MHGSNGNSIESEIILIARSERVYEKKWPHTCSIVSSYVEEKTNSTDKNYAQTRCAKERENVRGLNFTIIHNDSII